MSIDAEEELLNNAYEIVTRKVDDIHINESTHGVTKVLEYAEETFNRLEHCRRVESASQSCHSDDKKDDDEELSMQVQIKKTSAVHSRKKPKTESPFLDKEIEAAEHKTAPKKVCKQEKQPAKQSLPSVSGKQNTSNNEAGRRRHSWLDDTGSLGRKWI